MLNSKVFSSFQSSIIICVLIILIMSAFCLKKESPSIFIGDSGELTTAAVSLGISHPHGFPLFSLAGNCFNKIPLGSPAWRVNVLTSIAGAITLGIMFWLLLNLGLRPINACLLALFRGSGYVFMEITVGAEVYSLQLLIIVLCFLILLKKIRNYLPLSLFFAGIGIGTHITTIFLLLSIAILIFQNKQKKIIWLAFFLIGLSVFLYLPLRAVNQPAFNWGNPANWHNFLEHVMDKKDTQLLSQLSVKFIYANAKNFFSYLVDTFTPGGILLLFFGTYLGIREKIGWFMVLTIVFILPFFFLYLPLPRLPRAHLYAPIFLVQTFLLTPLFEKRVCPYLRHVKLTVILTMMAINLWRFTSLTNERNNFTLYDHAHNFLAASAPNSYLVTSGDITQYGILYLKTVEKQREDVQLFTQTPSLKKIYHLPNNFSSRRLLAKLKKQPLQFTWETHIPLPELNLISNGLLYGLEELPQLNFSRFSYRRFDNINPRKDFWYQYMFMNNLQVQAAYYSQLGKYTRSAFLLEKALTMGESTDISLDLAQNYIYLGEFGRAKEIINNLLKRKPNYPPALNLKEILKKQAASVTVS